MCPVQAGHEHQKTRAIRSPGKAASRSIGRSIGKRLSTPASNRIAASLANPKVAHGSRRWLIQRWAPRARCHQPHPRSGLTTVEAIDRQQ